jgi:protein-tyrosine phosphatase
MGEEYMRHRLADSGLSHVVVDSAGTLDIEGAPASPEARETVGRIGLDLSGHSSKGLSRTDLVTADMVMAMSHRHLDAIEVILPGGGAKVFLLRAFENGPSPERGAPDLEDPIGCSQEFYDEVFGIIRNCVDNLVIHLRHGDGTF